MVDLQALAPLRSIIRGRRPLTVLSGAGMSAESGVPTFRDEGGLWRERDPMELATPEAFIRDPKLFWEFYQERRRNLDGVQPNPGHRALAAFEQVRGDTWTITQNVDALHRVAGTSNLIEMHGCLWELRCSVCRYREEDRDLDFDEPPHCPDCGGMLRPNVVLFGETYPPRMLTEIDELLHRGGVLLVIGTSGQVAPAAFFAGMARSAGAYCVEINPSGTLIESDMNDLVRAPSGEVLPYLLGLEGLHS